MEQVQLAVEPGGQKILMVHLRMEKVSLNAQKCISGAIG